jgi:two-component system OmpR family response regulator
MRVYIVEDNATIRDTLLVTLAEFAPVRTAGYAETEEEGARWLARNDAPWDIAIVDLYLKAGSGLGILEACRYRNPKQKIVVLSNHATAEVRWRCAQLGADAVFDKATEIDNLLRYCVIEAEKLDPAAHQLYPA